MIGQFRRLAQRFRDEIVDLEREVQRALNSWEKSLSIQVDQDVYVDSTALNLHSFYSGLERLFELVAIRLDEETPRGESWHQELLHLAAQENPGLRPPIISSETARRLDDFRRFRHLIRHIYTSVLEPEKMQSLLQELPSLWTQIKSELESFAEFLDQIARADE